MPAYGTTALLPAPRALVVDDELAIRSVLQRYFERRGWDVDVAGDGEDALAFLGATHLPFGQSYDVIIADMRMGRMGGAELHRWMAQHRPDGLDSFIVATGDASDEATAMFLAESRCRVLQKPFELRELGELLVEVRGRDRD